MQSVLAGLCRRAAVNGVVSRRAVSSSLYKTATLNSNNKRVLAQNLLASSGAKRHLATSTQPAASTQPPAAVDLPVKTETICKTVPEAEITQESMLVPLSELVAIPDSFAVVQIGGKQYKVTQDDTIMVEKIEVPVQTQIVLDKVLLFGNRQMTAIGQPLLTNVKILAEVEEQALASKVLIFKKKRRHGYKRFKGHRQPYTLLRIKDIMARKD